MEASFEFSAELWESVGEAAWVFVTLPQTDSEDISELVPQRRGFGSVPVTARIGQTEWQTSVFPDKSRGAFVLPLKRSVREWEQLEVGETAAVTLQVRAD